MLPALDGEIAPASFSRDCTPVSIEDGATESTIAIYVVRVVGIERGTIAEFHLASEIGDGTPKYLPKGDVTFEDP